MPLGTPDRDTGRARSHPGVRWDRLACSLLSVLEGDLPSAIEAAGRELDLHAAYLVLRSESRGVPPSPKVVVWHEAGAESAEVLRVELSQSITNDPSIEAVNRILNEGLDQAAVSDAVTASLPAGDGSPLGFFGGYPNLEHDKEDEHKTDIASAAVLIARLLEQSGRVADRSGVEWRSFVEKSPAPILLLVEKRIAYANPASARLLGVTSSHDLLGRSIGDFVRADRHDLLGAAIGGPTAVDDKAHACELVRMDGQVRSVDIRIGRTDFGGAPAVEFVLTDTTESRESGDNYSHVVEAVAEGVIRIELRYHIPVNAPEESQVSVILEESAVADLNTHAQAFLGLERELDLRGKSLAELIGRGATDVATEFVRLGHRLFGFDHVVATDDSTRHYRLNMLGTIDDGFLRQIWLTCTDVTDSVVLETRLASALEAQQQRIGRELHDSVGQLLTGVRMLSENLAADYDESDAVYAKAARVANYASTLR